jgi:hypothetical protein
MRYQFSVRDYIALILLWALKFILFNPAQLNEVILPGPNILIFL